MNDAEKEKIEDVMYTVQLHHGQKIVEIAMPKGINIGDEVWFVHDDKYGNGEERHQAQSLKKGTLKCVAWDGVSVAYQVFTINKNYFEINWAENLYLTEDDAAAAYVQQVAGRLLEAIGVKDNE